MLLCAGEVVLSRHRLPQPYRVLLMLLWLAPAMLLTMALLVAHGVTVADFRLFSVIALMLLPALYVWRERVDATPTGIIRRIHWTRRYRYDALTHWEYRANVGVLRVWDNAGHVALECRSAHLTGFESLIEILETRVKAGAGARSDG